MGGSTTEADHRRIMGAWNRAIAVKAWYGEWHGDEGWGVVDLPGRSGGCFVHFSHIEAPEHTYRELIPGQRVSITWEEAEQDGYPALAIRVEGVS